MAAAAVWPPAAHAQEGLLLYVPNFNDNTVSVLQTAADGTASLQTTISGIGSSSLSTTVRGDQAYAYVPSRGTNQLFVINTATNAVVQTVATGTQPNGIVFSGDGTRAYLANNSSTVGVYDVDATTGQLTSVTTIATGGGSGNRAITVSPDGSRAYAIDQSLDRVSVIDTSTNSVLTTVAVGDQPLRGALNADGTRLYVTNFTDSTLSIVNTTTNSVVTTISLDFGGTNGRGPDGAAVSKDGKYVYVANRTTGNITVIDTATNSPIAITTVGPSANGVVVSPDGNSLYVTSQGAADRVNVYTIDTATGLLTANGTTAVGDSPVMPGMCNGSGLLGSGGSFFLRTSSALSCTGSTTPSFTGGTLIAGANNLTITNAMSLGSAGGTINTNGNDTVVSSVISGTGGLTKTGTGTLTLNGVNTYSGTTTISGGTLAVGDAAHAEARIAGDVSVGSGARLMGYGTIGGTVRNQSSGSVAPGGSIGTLTIVGDYVQGPNGTLAIEVSPSAADLLLVSGTASLDGTLALDFDAGSYSTRNYTIVDAGVITGDFATVTGTAPSGFVAISDIVDGKVLLGLYPSDTPPQGSTIATAAGTSALRLGDQAGQLILARIAGGLSRQPLGASASGSAQSPALEQLASAVPVSNAAALLDSAQDTVREAGAWFQPFGTLNKLDGESTTPSVDARTVGFLAGMDRPLGDDFFGGLSAGFAHTTLDEGSTSSGRISTPRAAVYGGWEGQGLVVTGLAGYARHVIKYDRTLVGTGSAAEGEYVADELMTSAQVGVPVTFDRLSLLPRAGLTYIRLFEDGYTETGVGDFALSAGSREPSSLRPFAALGAAYRMDAQNGLTVEPSIELAYSREMLDDAPERTASFAGSSITIHGRRSSRDRLMLTGGLRFARDQELDFNALYQSELPIGNTSSHTFQVQMTYRF